MSENVNVYRHNISTTVMIYCEQKMIYAFCVLKYVMAIRLKMRSYFNCIELHDRAERLHDGGYAGVGSPIVHARGILPIIGKRVRHLFARTACVVSIELLIFTSAYASPYDQNAVCDFVYARFYEIQTQILESESARSIADRHRYEEAKKVFRDRTDVVASYIRRLSGISFVEITMKADALNDKLRSRVDILRRFEIDSEFSDIQSQSFKLFCDDYYVRIDFVNDRVMQLEISR